MHRGWLVGTKPTDVADDFGAQAPWTTKQEADTGTQDSMARLPEPVVWWGHVNVYREAASVPKARIKVYPTSEVMGVELGRKCPAPGTYIKSAKCQEHQGVSKPASRQA